MHYSRVNYARSHRRHGTSDDERQSIAFAKAHVETNRSTIGHEMLEVAVETHIYHDVIFQVDPNGTITLIPTPDTVQVSRSFSSAQVQG